MYKNLKDFRKSLGMTQKEFAASLSIAHTTYSGYETGVREPKSDFWIAVAKKYGVTIDYLMGYSNDPHKTGTTKKASSLPDEALKVAKDYNGLDSHGKSMTRLVISEEQKRMDEEARTAEAVSAPPPTVVPFTPKKKTTHRGIVTLEVYEEPAAAGTGNFASDAPASHMEQYPEKYVPDHTDFGVIISGQSMEPKYPDKAVVFVKSTQVVEPGEIGIFLLDGQTYIKQLQVDPETGAVSLHSLNPERSDIEVEPYADFRTFGKVLGGYDPTAKKVIWK